MKKSSIHIVLLVLIFITGNICFAQQAKKKKSESVLKINIDSAMTISSANQKLLSYQFKTVYPPAGIDTNFKRSGFIHPLYAPHGQVLTRIQPPDHYHHYGIWNQWTHT